MSETPDRSKRHIAFSNGFEYFDRGGEVFRAPAYAVVMTDGYRCGRWECSREHFERHRDLYGFARGT